jgi:hypothetical protein
MTIWQRIGNALKGVFTPTVDAELAKVAETVVEADLEKDTQPKTAAPAPAKAKS